MKANTPELMKFKRLQRRLSVSVAQLVGHLELLWISTAKNTPEGDIGRFSNEDIAIACCWESDPDFFVNALVECGWLDASEEWRLLVHDWAQHAPTYVHGGLKRHGRSFRSGTSHVPKEAPKEAPLEAPIVGSYLDTPTKPSLFKPNQAKPSESRSKAPKENPNPLSEIPGFDQTWKRWKKHRIEKQKPLGAVEEDSQLMDLSRFGSEAIDVVEFSIRKGALNLITNGDHRPREPAAKKRGNGSDMTIEEAILEGTRRKQEQHK